MAVRVLSLFGMMLLLLSGVLVITRWLHPDLRLLIYRTSNLGDYKVYLTHSEGGETYLLSYRVERGLWPMWTPDGQAIILYWDRPDLATSGLYKTGYNGGKAEPFIVPLNQLYFTGTWSPNGEWLAFVSPTYRNWDIYRVRANGTELKRLTANLGFDRSPAWSPDGEWLAFSSSQTPTLYELYKMKADGSAWQNITWPLANDDLPTWTANGEWIIFESTRRENVDIYRIRPDGSDLERLTTHPSPDRFPILHEERVLFTSKRNGLSQLYRMQQDGSQQEQLTDLPGHVLTPQLSADGKWIVVQVVNDRRQTRLYRLNADGSRAKLLLDWQEDGIANVAWSPTAQWTWRWWVPAVLGLIFQIIPQRIQALIPFRSNRAPRLPNV